MNKKIMIKFNKLFACKIVLAAIAVVFLSTDIIYSTPISSKDSLRIPIGKESGTFQRMQQTMGELVPDDAKADGELAMAREIVANLHRSGINLLDIGAFTGEFLRSVARMNPEAGKLVGIDLGAKDNVLQEGRAQIELRRIDTRAGNWISLMEKQFYDVVTIVYPDSSSGVDLMSLFALAAWAIKPGGMIYIIADSPGYAERILFYMEQFFTDGRILFLPEEWPRSEHTLSGSSRENHRLVVGFRPDPFAMPETVRVGQAHRSMTETATSI